MRELWNLQLMQVSLSCPLGHILHYIQCLFQGLGWYTVGFVRRSVNLVAHSMDLDEMIWLEDSPPPAMEALVI